MENHQYATYLVAPDHKNRFSQNCQHRHPHTSQLTRDRATAWLAEGMSEVDGARPKVVCLCGSLRFQSLFESERKRLTSRGVIVLAPEPVDGEPTVTVRAALGELHLRRIDLADEIRVVSKGGYIGDATRREIQYAHAKQKVVSAVEAHLDL